MANLIKCPHCNREFEMTDVLKHQIEEDVKSAIENKLKKEIEEKSKMEFDDLERKLKEKDEKVKILQEQELNLREQKRKVEEKEKELELELTRKIDEARKNIEAEVLQKASDDHRLKDLEKDKLITDLKKSLEDAQRKANQGSQQSQGEVMELELEEILRREFPDDEISEVKKNPRVYHIFAADYVDPSEGTGIVTINGSYGETDMEAARKNKLPIVMDVNMSGHFGKEAGPYAGMSVEDAEKKLIEDMKKKGLVWRKDSARKK